MTYDALKISTNRREERLTLSMHRPGFCGTADEEPRHVPHASSTSSLSTRWDMGTVARRLQTRIGALRPSFFVLVHGCGMQGIFLSRKRFAQVHSAQERDVEATRQSRTRFFGVIYCFKVWVKIVSWTVDKIRKVNKIVTVTVRIGRKLAARLLRAPMAVIPCTST